MRKPGIVTALVTGVALAVGGAVALPAVADDPTEWVDGGTMTLNPGAGSVTFGDKTQTLATSGSCNLSTTPSLLGFAGSIGATSKAVGYKSGSLGVQEILASYCNLVDAFSSKGPETLTLALGSQMTNFADRELKVGSAAIALTVSSLLGKKAEVVAEPWLDGAQVKDVNGAPVTVTLKQATCGTNGGSVADNKACTLNVGVAFDTLKLTAKAGIFSLRTASTFTILSEVDKELDCTDNSLTDDNATLTYLGNADGSACSAVGVTLTSGATEVQFLKPLNVDPLAQFLVDVEWTKPSSGTPAVALPGVTIDFEIGTTERELPFCPASLYDGTGALVGVQNPSDISSLPDLETAWPASDPSLVQYACLGAPRTADIGATDLTIHDKVFVLGDAKMRLG